MSSYSSTTARLKKPNMRKDSQQSLDLNLPLSDQRDFSSYSSESRNASRSAQDVTFTSSRRGYTHARSTSGASQTGSFVHPFQQPPSDSKPHRPFTPTQIPSHNGSFIGSEYSASVLPEEDEPLRSYRHHPNTRTASTLSDYTNPSSTVPPSLRLQTKSSSFIRLPGTSQTNLHSTVSLRSPDLASPSEAMSPVSALRTSMDKGFRIRTRSDADCVPQQESIQEMRRKFDEKERVKEEKVAREEVRQREKQNLKEARLYEKTHRKSTGSDGATRAKRSRSDLTTLGEKSENFVAQDYNNVPLQEQPATEPAESRTAPRSRHTGSNTKKNATSSWAKFVMWIRTRFLRMGKSSSR